MGEAIFMIMISLLVIVFAGAAVVGMIPA